jgi:hypothetical protein
MSASPIYSEASPTTHIKNIRELEDKAREKYEEYQALCLVNEGLASDNREIKMAA